MPRFVLPVTFNNSLLPTLPSIGKTIFSDSFNRSNGAPGSTEVGRLPWQVYGTDALVSIKNNALWISGSSTSACLGVINVGQTEGRFRAKSVGAPLSADKSDSGYSPVLVLRAIDVSNYVAISQAYKAETGKAVWRISSRVDGKGGIEALEFDGDARANDLIEVSISGNTYSIWKNGSLKLADHVITHCSSGTRFGIGKNAGKNPDEINTLAWDDLIFISQ